MIYDVIVRASKEMPAPRYKKAKIGWEAICISRDEINDAFRRVECYTDYSCFTYRVGAREDQ